MPTMLAGINLNPADYSELTNNFLQYGYVAIPSSLSQLPDDLPFIQSLSPRYMSSEDDTVPDLPPLNEAYDELECLACSTTVHNTNKDNNCVVANNTKIAKCKSLSW